MAHGLLLGNQAAANRNQRRDGAYYPAHLHGSDCLLDVFAIENGSVLPLGIASKGEIDLIQGGIDGPGIDGVGCCPTLPYGIKCHHAVHGSGVDVEKSEGRCKALGERGLTRRCVAVHGDANERHRLRLKENWVNRPATW